MNPFLEQNKVAKEKKRKRVRVQIMSKSTKDAAPYCFHYSGKRSLLTIHIIL